MTKIKEEWSPDSLEFIELILCLFQGISTPYPAGLYSVYWNFFQSIEGLLKDNQNIKFYKRICHALCNKSEDDLIIPISERKEWAFLIDKELAKKILVLAELSNVEYKFGFEK